MSDDAELERIKRQRLAEMQRSLAKKQEVKPKAFNSEEILRKIFVGRAWEVYSAARQQYPMVAGQIFRELAMLVQSGRLRGQITGEQLFGLLRQIGLDVRLDTKIQVMEHGELKSLGDKFRGS
jgi:DNA-binding TFAR19-related protein (PDSD5 family)